MRIFGLITAALCVLLTAGAGATHQPKGGSGDPRTLGGQLKPYPSKYYTIYTDVDADTQREAALRMTKMAEEYTERTQKLFRGRIGGRLPFYLYAKGDDYYKAGGAPGSAGVFNGECLMAMAVPGKNGRVGPGTWHVVQHEGFHQYVKSVIRGDIPIWVNEGMAEYFGEGLFTGDDMVTGVVPAPRLERVQQRLKDKAFPTIRDMMRLSHKEWNAAFTDNAKASANYDMAWMMVHFLAHAENGKYQDAFGNFLVLTGRGRPWEQAWASSFGSVEGFEEKWKAYWAALPKNATPDLYARSAVATLTSFAARAASQQQTFATIDELLATDSTKMKHHPDDWLPPSLFDDAKALAASLKAPPVGAVFTLVKNNGLLAAPTIECTLPDGTKVTGTAALTGGRVGKVSASVGKADPKKAPPKPPAPRP